MNAESEKRYRKFIHDIAHDLQEPVSKVITISELLTEKLKNIDEADRDYLMRLYKSGKEMKKIIEDLTVQALPND